MKLFMTRDEREELAKPRVVVERRAGPRAGARTIALGAIGGLALAYLFDPENGRRRRAMLGDRLGSIGRRGSRAAERARRYAGSTVRGTRERIAAAADDQDELVDDITLTDRVESQVFRDRDLPKGELNIDTVGGVVMIRGQVDHSEVMNEIVARTWRVAGVKDVRNLMHLPGTPAPHID